MKISVIIPVYNVEKYIEACLSSVARQCFEGEIECLLVDDCGTDRSVEIASRFIESTSSRVQFRILHYEHNRGAAGARNEGLRYATGDYVFFLDGDDILPSGALKKLSRPLIEFPEADFSVGIICPTKANVGLDWMHTCLNKLPLVIKDSVQLKKMILSRFQLYMTACNKLLKRSLFLNPQMFFNESVTHEDDHWNYYLAKFVKTACVVKEVTYSYVIHDDSKSYTFNQEKYDADYLMICEDWASHIDSVCQRQQVQVIHSLLLPIMVFSTVKEHRNRAKNIIRIVAAYSSPFGRIVSNSVCALPPKWILRLRIYGLLEKYSEFWA